MPSLHAISICVGVSRVALRPGLAGVDHPVIIVIAGYMSIMVGIFHPVLCAVIVGIDILGIDQAIAITIDVPGVFRAIPNAVAIRICQLGIGTVADFAVIVEIITVCIRQ